MKKFHVNIIGDFNIYGEIIPINAFYGKIDGKIYYCCITKYNDFLDISRNIPRINGVVPLPVYVWDGEVNGFILRWDWGKIAQTIQSYATHKNAWNNGIKKDVLYGMGNTLREKTAFISDVSRKHKSSVMKQGSSYHARQRHKNVGEIPLNVGECIISRTFNTGRSFSKNDL